MDIAMNRPATNLPTLGNGLDPTPIVARLSAMPGVQRLPSPKLTLFIARDVLPPLDHRRRQWRHRLSHQRDRRPARG
jgi:hypothetical protein